MTENIFNEIPSTYVIKKKKWWPTIHLGTYTTYTYTSDQIYNYILPRVSAILPSISNNINLKKNRTSSQKVTALMYTYSECCVPLHWMSYCYSVIAMYLWVKFEFNDKSLDGHEKWFRTKIAVCQSILPLAYFSMYYYTAIIWW